MRWNSWVLMFVVPLGVTGLHAQEREAPAAQCVDARAVADGYQVDALTLALRGMDGRRHQLTLAEACPGVMADADLQLVGWNGWVCGAEGETVRSAGRDCAISRVDEVDARTYAELVRQSQDAPQMARVVVQGRKVKGFRGTPDYCVASRRIRSWHEDAEGLVVEVPPMRSGGNRFYRVETGSCSLRGDTAEVALVSATGTGLVCGHPGDQVVFSAGLPERVAATEDHMLRGGELLGVPSAVAARCRVTGVYPLES